MKVHYCPEARVARPLCQRQKSPVYDRPHLTTDLRKVTCEHCLATIRNEVYPRWVVRGQKR